MCRHGRCNGYVRICREVARVRRAELICVANRTLWNIHSVGGQWLSGGDIKGSDVFDGLVGAVAAQLGHGGPGKADDVRSSRIVCGSWAFVCY